MRDRAADHRLPKRIRRMLDEMVRRRVENTGETPQQAAQHVAAYLRGQVAARPRTEGDSNA